MRAHVTAICRYPVKGLSGERLTDARLTAGEPLPFDRMYAIENGPGAFDERAPRHPIAAECRRASLASRAVRVDVASAGSAKGGARRDAEPVVRIPPARSITERGTVGGGG